VTSSRVTLDMDCRTLTFSLRMDSPSRDTYTCHENVEARIARVLLLTYIQLCSILEQVVLHDVTDDAISANTYRSVQNPQ
jgi:hypothetical protein